MKKVVSFCLSFANSWLQTSASVEDCLSTSSSMITSSQAMMKTQCIADLGVCGVRCCRADTCLEHPLIGHTIRHEQYYLLLSELTGPGVRGDKIKELPALRNHPLKYDGCDVGEHQIIYLIQGDNWANLPCWYSELQSNTSDVLFVSYKHQTGHEIFFPNVRTCVRAYASMRIGVRACMCACEQVCRQMHMCVCVRAWRPRIKDVHFSCRPLSGKVVTSCIWQQCFRYEAVCLCVCCTSESVTQEERQGWRYDYYVFMDDDVNLFVHGGLLEAQQSIRSFEVRLMQWQPALGVPFYGCNKGLDRCGETYRSGADMISTFHSDHIMIAFHRESVHELWPLTEAYDSECWWTSQWVQSMLAGMHFKHHYLMDMRLEVANGKSRPYPRNCEASFCKATLDTLKNTPDSVLPCFRPPHSSMMGAEGMRCKEQLVRYLASRIGTYRQQVEQYQGETDDCNAAKHACIWGEPHFKPSSSYTLQKVGEATSSSGVHHSCQLWFPWDYTAELMEIADSSPNKSAEEVNAERRIRWDDVILIGS